MSARSSRSSAKSPSARAALLGQEALALRRAGKHQEAAALLRKAVRLAPEHPGLAGNLGNALLALGERKAALAALERATRLDPRSGLFAYNLGRALLDAGELARARAAFERAIAQGGVAAHAHVNLGRVDEIEGHLEAAAEHWRLAAEAAPDLARPHYLLARVGRLVDRRPLEALAARQEAPASERAEAHFGLGYAFDREGAYARAFEHFQAGNRLKRALIPPFDPAEHEAFVARLMRAFDADLFRALEPADASEAPLFLVGLPRSGTTLAESILAAHPQVAARGERTEIDALARALRTRGYPEKLPAPDERRRAAAAYLAALALPASALRATDKMPGNSVHLALIALLFPRARIIHCRRDPLDTALSLYCQLFDGAALPYSYDLDHIARVTRAHRRLMAHWRAVLPLPLHELDYEPLVQDFEPTARALVAFAGLPWDDRCLTRASGPVRTASAWRVRATVDATSVGRCRRYERELAPWSATLTE